MRRTELRFLLFKETTEKFYFGRIWINHGLSASFPKKDYFFGQTGESYPKLSQLE